MATALSTIRIRRLVLVGVVANSILGCYIDKDHLVASLQVGGKGLNSDLATVGLRAA